MTEGGLLGACVFHLKKTFDLNFGATENACCSETHMHFTHYVVRARFGTSPRREITSLSMNLFRELFQVVNRIVTKSSRFVSVMLRVGHFVIMRVPS